MAEEKRDPMEVLDDVPEKESIEQKRSDDYDADIDLAPA